MHKILKVPVATVNFSPLQRGGRFAAGGLQLNEDKSSRREDSLYRRIRSLYPRLQRDIEENKNLSENLIAIESCMDEIAGFISQSRQSGKSTALLETVYRELEEIKEKILKALSVCSA